MLTITTATAADLPLIQSLIHDLATYERLAHEAAATREDLGAALFSAAPRVFCDIARWQGEPAGMAIWFYNFSTFRGRHGLYLEDLFVKPAQRGHGIGAGLLKHLAERCMREGLGRFEWSVLDWNEPAIGFYRSLGARPMQEWTVWRLDDEDLQRLGGGS